MCGFSEVLWTFMLDYTKGWGVRLHQHDFLQMYYCISGEGVFNLDGQRLLLQENMCLIIHPNQPHELLPMKDGQMRIIDTKFYIHSPELLEVLCSLPQFMEIPDPEFRDLCTMMRNEWASKTPYAKEMANAIFQQILLLYLRKNTEAPSRIPFYKELEDHIKNLTGLERKIAQHLQDHYLESISLNQLSSDLRYSKTYLCKVFRSAAGITISEYVNFLRIRKAYDLICCTEKKISEISLECGFSSIHYFSRTFHKIAGMTPSQARNLDRNALYTDIRLHGSFRWRYYSPVE